MITDIEFDVVPSKNVTPPVEMIHSNCRALVMNSLSISLHSAYDSFPIRNLIWFQWIFDGIQSSLRQYDFICKTIKIPNFNFFFALWWWFSFCIERTKINTVGYLHWDQLFDIFFFLKMGQEERGEIYSKINNKSSIFPFHFGMLEWFSLVQNLETNDNFNVSDKKWSGRLINLKRNI